MRNTAARMRRYWQMNDQPVLVEMSATDNKTSGTNLGGQADTA